MNCLHGYIGIKGCGNAIPEGGYINVLPGISLKSIQGTADSEQVTYLAVFEDIQERAWMRLCDNLRQSLRSKFAIKSTRGFANIGISVHGENKAASAEYRGLMLDAGVDENGFFAFSLSSIGFYATRSGNVEFSVFDRYGNLLSRFTKACEEGDNTIDVNETYAASLIFVCVNASALETVGTVIADDQGELFNAMFTGFGDCCNPAVTGAHASLDNAGKRVKTSDTYGLSFSATPICDYTSIICRNKVLFKRAWLNLLGAELCIERMYSERMNRWTNIGAKEAQQLYETFLGEYENALEETVKGIRIGEHDACIECSPSFYRRETLP